MQSPRSSLFQSGNINIPLSNCNFLSSAEEIDYSEAEEHKEMEDFDADQSVRMLTKRKLCKISSSQNSQFLGLSQYDGTCTDGAVTATEVLTDAENAAGFYKAKTPQHSA